MDKMKEFGIWLWDWAKRIFGRSKIIFANVMAVFLAGWVELYDPIAMFDWSSITDKHEVALGIGIAINLLNIFLRMYATQVPARFGRLNEDDEIREPILVYDPETALSVEAYPPSPKAN